MEWHDKGGALIEISGSSLCFRLLLLGLRTEHLETIFRGRGNPPPASAASISCWPASFSDSAPELAPDPSTADWFSLTDGGLMLASGQPGLLTPAWDNSDGEFLIPQSLNLLLSQQWARLGLMTLHAAVIRVRQQGVLVLGDRGSGKSVLAAAALSGGGAVVSDDWVLVGAQEGGFMAERLRGFLMLRSGWATERLRQSLGFEPGSRQHKSVFLIPESDARFPSGTKIDRVWLLRRPRAARAEFSEIHPLARHQALGEFITAGMPILFSRQFPQERGSLMSMLRGLLADRPLQLVETGLDLIEQPADTLARLMRD